MDDKLYFAGDNGILVEHDLVEDTVYREISITQKGRIRSDLQYVAAEHAIYATSNAGEICRFDGSEVTTYTMFPRAKAVNCTSTMSIVDDTAYVGAMADGMGYLCVWDMQTHSCLLYTSFSQSWRSYRMAVYLYRKGRVGDRKENVVRRKNAKVSV